MRDEIIGRRYRLKDRLGEGGMAVVYTARDEKLSRKVAVKLLHQHFAENPEIRQRFELEAKAISAMDHPNIVKVFDYSGADSKQLWIVTELLKGKNLADFVRGFPKHRLNSIIGTCIVREVCKALEHAHKHEIIHRDIKPENIMVIHNGQIKLMDFGIAKNLHSSSMTMTGTFMGSPSYMSPEQIRGRGVDGRSDVYSLGVLFYEILTGVLPYTGNTTHEVVLRIMEGKYRRPRSVNPDIPRELEKIIIKSMSMNPEHRFQTVRSMSRELDRALSLYGFAESHVELERFFLDQRTFNTRLKKANLTGVGNPRSQRTTKSRTAHPGQAPDKRLQNHQTTKEPRDREESRLTAQHTNQNALLNPTYHLPPDLVHAQQQVRPSSRRDHQLPTRVTRQGMSVFVPPPPRKNQSQYKTQGLDRQTRNTLRFTQMDWSDHYIQEPRLNVAKPARRRVRPKVPRRTRPVGRKVNPSLYRTRFSSPLVGMIGVVLVAIVFGLTVWGFTSIKSKTDSSPNVRNAVPRVKQTPTRNTERNVQPVERQNVEQPTRQRASKPAQRASDANRNEAKRAQREASTAQPRVSQPRLQTNPPPQPQVTNERVAVVEPRIPTESRQEPPVEQTQVEEEAKPQPLKPGYLEFVNMPAAEIFVNGNRLCTIPCSRNETQLDPGIYTIRAERTGYEASSKRVRVNPGATTRVSLRFSVPEAFTVIFSWIRTPVMASFVDAKTGRVVLKKRLSPLTKKVDLPKGDYRLELRQGGDRKEINLFYPGAGKTRYIGNPFSG